ncbi:MAG: hypothetical protein H6661_07380 [Ardenticatenaceae bacterium]|nr:hypothetical protein [Ardenticatenaceae bacterium]
MNDYFEEDGSDFLLTDQEAMKTWKNMTTYLLYLLLMVVVIVTAAHGIMVKARMFPRSRLAPGPVCSARF